MASIQGWGRETWGSGAWGQQAPVEATGVGLTSATATPTITGACNVTLTGLGTTSAVGTGVATGGQNLTAAGQQLQSNTNTPTSVVGSANVTPTGLGTTSSLGSESVFTGFQSGWGRAFAGSSNVEIGWGDNLWGITAASYALTGVSATSTPGTMTFQGDVAPTITSAGMSIATGTLGTSAFATGVGATSSIGTFSISGDGVITVVASSEPELDASLGTVSVGISPTVLPVGEQLTASLGTEIATGGAIVSPTGIGLVTSLGTEIASTDVNVVGDGGTVTKVVTVISTAYGNKYVIDGIQQDTLELAEGNTYKLDQSDSSNDGHPLKFSTTSDGTHGGGSAYTTGVYYYGVPGNSGAYTQITVATGAPTLYYYCSIHSGMGGQANTPVSDANEYSASGSSSFVGSVVAAGGVEVTPTGQSATSAVGQASQESSYALTGVSLTASPGNPNVSGNAIFTITGVSATSSVGSLDITGWNVVDDSNSSISWTEVTKAA